MENIEIPFNLELAKQGHPVKTRDGRKARIICFDQETQKGFYRMIALVRNDEGNKKWGHELDILMFYSLQGKVSLIEIRSNWEDWTLLMA